MVAPKSLSEAQSTIFTKIIARLTKPSENGNAFFVHGAAGTGKTFLLNQISKHCESNDIITIALAYTGVASCLIRKGKTVHSQFRIPWNRKKVTCMLDSSRPMYHVLKRASVLLWDQAAFCSKQIFEEVDRFLRIMMNSQQIFGGKVVVVCGDFNECLPISKKTKFESAESHSLLFSNLFKQMEKFTLHENHRFNKQTDYRFCLNIGSGVLSQIAIPSQCRVFNLDTLINTTYGFDYKTFDAKDLIDRSILTLCTIDVDYLNNECMKRMCETKIQFHSSNYFRKIDPEQCSRFYPIDDIMKNLPKYFPPNILEVQKNCPIILRQSYKGLAQGTRLVVKNLSKTAIIAEIGAGHRKGKVITIHRVQTAKTFHDANLIFVRIQFPVSLCYAMTINKAQGLNFKRVGVYFPCTVFGHGQMYVTFSRTPTIEENMKVFVVEPVDGQFTFDCMPNMVNTTVAKLLSEFTEKK